MDSSSILDQPILSLSNGTLDQLQHADMSELESIWGVFNKCKKHLENGDRLEYMSWRLWQHKFKATNRRIVEEKKNDNNTLFQPSAVYDAYPHEVSQPFQKYYSSTIHNHEKRLLIEWTPPTDEPISPLSSSSSSYDKTRQQQDSSRCSDIIPCTSLRMITPPLENQRRIETIIDDDDYDDDYDDDDYFLSDDDYDEDEDDDKVNYSFVVNEFKKTQPRPATPRRSLLSDLLQKQCPSRSPSNQYLSPSSSTTSFEQDLSQSLRDSLHRESWFSSSDSEHISQVAVHKKPRNNNPSESRWLESFHGW